MELTKNENAKKIINWAAAKKAENIKYYDVQGQTEYTDAIIICSGTGEIHNRAIADTIIRNAKDEKIQVQHIEGYDNSKWILLDLIDIVVHIFEEETRKYYSLNEIFSYSLAKESVE
ncbi:MAG: ribosome silencing factor [Candidatus Cloacimonetes bacterium]|nr:ribosome silencing factor [Candidatus Cloacimonadota bacterium]